MLSLHSEGEPCQQGHIVVVAIEPHCTIQSFQSCAVHTLAKGNDRISVDLSLPRYSAFSARTALSPARQTPTSQSRYPAAVSSSCICLFTAWRGSLTIDCVFFKRIMRNVTLAHRRSSGLKNHSGVDNFWCKEPFRL